MSNPTIGQQVDSLLAAEQAKVAALQAQLAVTPFVANGADLATMFPSAAKRYGAPGASYQFNNTATSQVNAGGFVGNSTINLKPVPGGSSGLYLHGSNIEIGGARLTGPAWGIRAIGNDPSTGAAPPAYWFHDLTFDGSLSGGIDLEQWADGTRISHCTFGIVGAQGIYCTADDLTITDCTFLGSQGEHCLRTEVNATTKHRPQNLLVAHCKFTNANALGKETVAIREIVGATFIDCDFYGWVDVGQGNTDTISHATNVRFERCRWHTLRPGGMLLDVRHDSTVTLVDCTFPGSATDAAIVADARSHVTLIDCSLSVTPGLNPKPLIIASDPSAVIVQTQ